MNKATKLISVISFIGLVVCLALAQTNLALADFGYTFPTDTQGWITGYGHGIFSGEWDGTVGRDGFGSLRMDMTGDPEGWTQGSWYIDLNASHYQVEAGDHVSAAVLRGPGVTRAVVTLMYTDTTYNDVVDDIISDWYTWDTLTVYVSPENSGKYVSEIIVSFSFIGGIASHVGWADDISFHFSGGATPTPMYMTPLATGLPRNTDACVTATPTQTPTPRMTVTRFMTPETATPTPTGTLPTPTPTVTTTATLTATATVTHSASYDSGLAEFRNDMYPWGITGPKPPAGALFGLTGWSSYTGTDGIPGTISVSLGMAYRELLEPFTETVILLPELIDSPYFSLEDAGVIYQPIHLSGEARVPGLLPGVEARLRLWVLISDTWQSRWNAHEAIGSDWQHFDYRISRPGERVRAVALTYFYRYYPDNPLVDNGFLYLDNLRVTAGEDLKLQVCSPTVTGGGDKDRPVKQCLIKLISVDVLGDACTAPTDLLNIGGWISYLWCRLSIYFTFVNENRAQMDAITERLSDIEPFGSVIDLTAVAWGFVDFLRQLQERNHVTGQLPDFSSVFDGSALDQNIEIKLNEVQPVDLISQCPQEIFTISQRTTQGACAGIYFMRASPAVQFVQWALNLSFVAWGLYAIYIIINQLSK